MCVLAAAPPRRRCACWIMPHSGEDVRAGCCPTRRRCVPWLLAHAGGVLRAFGGPISACTPLVAVLVGRLILPDNVSPGCVMLVRANGIPSPGRSVGRSVGRSSSSDCHSSSNTGHRSSTTGRPFTVRRQQRPTGRSASAVIARSSVGGGRAFGRRPAGLRSGRRPPRRCRRRALTATCVACGLSSGLCSPA